MNAYQGKGERILVVDDVEEQRTIAQKMLTLLVMQFIRRVWTKLIRTNSEVKLAS